MRRHLELLDAVAFFRERTSRYFWKHDAPLCHRPIRRVGPLFDSSSEPGAAASRPPNGIVQIWSDMVAAMSPEEQAKMYAEQGCLVRAVVMYRKLAETEPTVENLSMLAALYMEEGLHEDAQALYLRVVQMESNRP